MKAKDTVIGTQENETATCPKCGNEFCICDVVYPIRLEQAEISFKAGMKEVIKWIKGHHCLAKGCPSNNDWIDCLGIEEKEWQSQLKEWRID